jgi:serine/threonine protein kinase
MDAPDRLSGAPPWAPAAGSHPAFLGPYRLLRPIGEGGMGVVHLATAPGGTRVAVKVLRPHVVATSDGRRRLAREVAALQRVRSDRVAAFLDSDAWAERPYVVTRFVPGLSLSEYVDEYGPMRGPALLRVARGLAEALAAVHAVGVVHRDVKPSNVLLEDRDPVLIDFGLARAADDQTVTIAGWMLGTPAYMTPEIAEGRDPESAVDVYAWASTMAFACTGRSPFGSGHQAVVLDRVRRNDYDLTGVPSDLRAILERCLVLDPRTRPSAALLVDWLARLIDGGPPPADRTTVSLHKPATAAPREVPAAPSWASSSPTQADQPRTAAQPAVDGMPPEGPAQEPPRTHDSVGSRLMRFAVAATALACAAAVFLAAPYVAALLWWLGATGILAWQLAAESRTRRQLLRGGPAASDRVVAVVASPWHGVLAAASAALLIGAALLAAGLTGGMLHLVGVPDGAAVAVATVAFAIGLYRGPGGFRLHRPLAAAVTGCARLDLVGLGIVWLLLALTAGSLGVVETVGTIWWPDTGAPW